MISALSQDLTDDIGVIIRQIQVTRCRQADQNFEKLLFLEHARDLTDHAITREPDGVR
jgi:hypothetical protein